MQCCVRRTTLHGRAHTILAGYWSPLAPLPRDRWYPHTVRNGLYLYEDPRYRLGDDWSCAVAHTSHPKESVDGKSSQAD